MHKIFSMFFLALFVSAFSSYDVLAVDTAYPNITSPVQISSYGNTVNTDGGDVNIVFTFRAVDADSGFCLDCSDLYLYHSSDESYAYYDVTTERISGTVFDGTYRAAVTIPQYAPGGTYNMIFRATDFNNNTISTGSSVFSQIGLGSTLTNHGVNYDKTDPVIGGLPTVSPSVINTDNGYQLVTVTFRATDNLSGVCAIGDGCRRASNIELDDSTRDSIEVTRISGNARDGEYQAQALFPPGTTQNLDEMDVDIYDRVGNRFNLEFDAPITNNGTNRDSQDPVVTHVRTISPSMLDIDKNGPQEVYVILDIEDNISGVCADNDTDCDARVSVYFDYGITSEDDEKLIRLSGNRLKGTYKLSFTVTDIEVAGEYTFELEVRDQVGYEEGYDFGLAHPIRIGTLSAPTGPERNVYRFYSETYRSHFYTASEFEKDLLIASNDNWAYEAVAYEASSEDQSAQNPVYRFYSAQYNSHFYTMSESERDRIIANDSNWAYEGVAYYTYNSDATDRSAAYRFYSDIYQSHFYTTSESERDSLINNDPNWRYEGVAWYVAQ